MNKKVSVSEMNYKEKLPSTYETLKKIRNDWGNVNPVTKVIPNKKKNPKIKHKSKENDYEGY